MASVRFIPMHYNSVYLVERGGERLLIDTGPDYEGAWEHLQAAVGGRGPDVVAATHGHQDHAGLGAAWQRVGVPVTLGRADWTFAEQPRGHGEAELRMLGTIVAACGAPGSVAQAARSGLERRRTQMEVARSGYPPPGSRPRWPTGLQFVPYTPARHIDGQALPTGMHAVACPGHTPGNHVFVVPEEGWLFSGDQLLPDITPTPSLQLDAAATARFRSLPAFLSSLEGLLSLEIRRCFPGHGEPFDDPASVIRANISAIETRTQRVLQALRDEGPATLYELCVRLYPRALQRRFWQILPTVIGHLDLLEERQAARSSDGHWEAC